jgi:hypothetical protein
MPEGWSHLLRVAPVHPQLVIVQGWRLRNVPGDLRMED